MRTVIVYGPPGCGKSLNAERIREHFGCADMVEEWRPTQPLQEGCVHLTSVDLIDQDRIVAAAAEVHHYASIEDAVCGVAGMA